MRNCTAHTRSAKNDKAMAKAYVFYGSRQILDPSISRSKNNVKSNGELSLKMTTSKNHVIKLLGLVFRIPQFLDSALYRDRKSCYN